MTKERAMALANKPDPVPEGYRSVLEWAAAWGLSRPQAYRLLVSAGDAVDYRLLRVRARHGGLHSTPYYAYKEELAAIARTRRGK